MRIGDRIKNRRKFLGLSVDELAEKLGRNRATIYRYENGNIERLPLNILFPLAKALETTPAYLMGWSEDSEIKEDTDGQTTGTKVVPEGFSPLPIMKTIPLVGEIACGEPILAEQNITEQVPLPAHIHADFALVCRGDSMTGAGIEDGDVVYIRQQPTVESGQIAAVRIGESATLKRVRIFGGFMVLSAENPRYADIVLNDDDFGTVQIEGLAVGLSRIWGDGKK